MLRALLSEGGGFEKKLTIAEGAVEGINWFTVFIAENGGRKSHLLRCITEASLGRERYRADRVSGTIYLTPPDPLPKRVIAISGTPLDRFPRHGTRDLRSQARKIPRIARMNFVYLGPRASNGMAGLAQSERSLVGSLVSNRHSLKERWMRLSHVFAHLGLSAQLEIFLQTSVPRDAESRLDVEQEQSLLEEVERDARLSTHQENKELLTAIVEFRSFIGRKKTLSALDELRTKRTPSLRLAEAIMRPGSRLSVAMWELLLRIGYVYVKETRFKRIGRAGLEISGDKLSSGQWAWLGAFGSLVAELRNETLILIDEPENSLHPSWQRTFMQELHGNLEPFHGCQVIVATHSPLIAAGVSPSWGNIRTLKRANRSNAVVRSEGLTNAFGWNAIDVYDEIFGLSSTRAPGFLELANLALSRFANGERIEHEDAENWARAIELAMQSLPQFDPLRTVLLDITNKLEPLALKMREQQAVTIRS